MKKGRMKETRSVKQTRRCRFCWILVVHPPSFNTVEVLPHIVYQDVMGGLLTYSIKEGILILEAQIASCHRILPIIFHRESCLALKVNMLFADCSKKVIRYLDKSIVTQTLHTGKWIAWFLLNQSFMIFFSPHPFT